MPRSALQVTEGFNAFVTVAVKVILVPDIVEVAFGATLTVIAGGVAVGVAVTILLADPLPTALTGTTSKS